ncbi:ATP-grasp domain-containing protein [Streptomyces triticiradicis]|uniref:ATP-grasp domain-containing protein n=1 Tax=Streptomyces triticiradicis TaxID=2651189 RepID=A0A7J5D5F7_9ACTN|nr:ATP-grasp domain-containing protein [Streptomyces triticiradicis]KAB1979143.1 ATP-grasp domain-containing protein [Streptomyces triticiradicis]
MSCHLLLVGADEQRHATAHRLGLRLTLLTGVSSLGSLRDLARYGRVIAVPDSAPVEEWTAAARTVAAYDPVDALGAFAEETQEHAVAVADALGLPCHPAGTIRLAGHGPLLRARLRDAGVDGTAASEVRDTADVEAFAAVYGYPLVLKPVDGMGTGAASVIRSAAGLTGPLPPGRRMMVEEYLDGEEYGVEAFSERGVHRLVCVSQTLIDPVARVRTGHCLPAPAENRLRADVEAFLPQVLDAVGVRDGPTHTRIVMTDAGPRVVRVRLRPGGDRMVELVALALGLDLDELWVRHVCGERVLDELNPRLSRAAAVRFVTPRAPGLLERCYGAEEASAIEGVEGVHWLREPGSLYPGALTPEEAGACVVATGDSGQQAVARSLAAAARLRFVVVCAG